MEDRSRLRARAGQFLQPNATSAAGAFSLLRDSVGGSRCTPSKALLSRMSRTCSHAASIPRAAVTLHVLGHPPAPPSSSRPSACLSRPFRVPQKRRCWWGPLAPEPGRSPCPQLAAQRRRARAHAGLMAPCNAPNCDVPERRYLCSQVASHVVRSAACEVAWQGLRRDPWYPACRLSLPTIRGPLLCISGRGLVRAARDGRADGGGMIGAAMPGGQVCSQ